MLFAGDPNATNVHFTDVKPLEKKTTAGGGGAKGAQNNTTSTTTAVGDSNTSENTSNTPGTQGFLRVMAPSFDLKTTASAARRTSPRLVLATGERGDAESKNGPWLRRRAVSNGDGGDSNGGVGFVTRSSPRPGSRNPAWKDGEFWLSLEGLQEPALFLALEDAKKESLGEGVSEDAIIAQACIPLPLEEGRRRGDGGRWGSRSSATLEAELSNRAGLVSLQWSTHKDTSSR